ncbi:MAG: ABC transporter ATP-binding protein [Erysipelotrichaceae bacterium]|nr:ABC transporter ATP-binding protein [Erysipelotrichaceae bacterium]
MSVLRCEHLSKTYGAGDSLVKALDDISFSVEKGEFVAVTGTSGSGKSTLLHIIGGVDRPGSGNVYINDTDLHSLTEDALAVFRRRNIGLIYQFYNLIPVLNIDENIILPSLLDGKAKDQNKLDEIVSYLNLNDRRTHLPSELSGGQQQRVSIGRALYTEPMLLLCDEPTGNLDSKAGKEIVNLLKSSNREYGQTVILVTHDESIAKEADRIIRIADGKIISDERGSI